MQTKIFHNSFQCRYAKNLKERSQVGVTISTLIPIIGLGTILLYFMSPFDDVKLSQPLRNIFDLEYWNKLKTTTKKKQLDGENPIVSNFNETSMV